MAEPTEGERIVDEYLDEMMSPREYAATKRALITAIDAAISTAVAGERERAESICEEQQIALGEWKEMQATWESMDKRQVWNEAVIHCAETIAAIRNLEAAKETNGTETT